MVWVEQIQSLNPLHVFTCLVGGYALGCFGIGYYLVRSCTGHDIRQIGSGGVGARNVGRVLGRRGFCATLMFDFAKGGFAVWAARHWTSSDILTGMTLLAVTVGHVWPLQLGFRGGKGVATSLGGLLIFDWRLLMTYALAFAVFFVLMRRTVLSGLFAYLVLPVTVWCFHSGGLEVALVGGLIAVVLFAHRDNLLAELPELTGRGPATVHSNKPET